MVVNKVTMPVQPNINMRRVFLNRKVKKFKTFIPTYCLFIVIDI